MKPRAGVLVGHAHQRMSEGLRDWLQASFEVVFIVADKPSLLDGAGKLQPALILADTALAAGDVAALLTQLHGRAPGSRILLVSSDPVACADLAALVPGRDGIVRTDALVRDLSCAVEAVLAGRDFGTPAADANAQAQPGRTAHAGPQVNP